MADGVNRWAHLPVTAGQRAEIRERLETWRRGGPCPVCLWPFPNAAQYHLCPGQTVLLNTGAR